MRVLVQPRLWNHSPRQLLTQSCSRSRSAEPACLAQSPQLYKQMAVSALFVSCRFQFIPHPAPRGSLLVLFSLPPPKSVSPLLFLGQKLKFANGSSVCPSECRSPRTCSRCLRSATSSAPRSAHACLFFSVFVFLCRFWLLSCLAFMLPCCSQRACLCGRGVFFGSVLCGPVVADVSLLLLSADLRFCRASVCSLRRTRTRIAT